MAVVYLARQTDLDREVALKELAAFHAADPAFVGRFLREARLAGSLNHPSIVTVYEYFEHEGTAFIAMEYFARGSLRPHVPGVSLAQTAGILEGLLSGLAHAEAHGVVHRDLKPENVMVTSSGGVKIADFGLAKALQATPGGSITASDATVGTPAYMAPEQAAGGEIGPWTDLYAVGVMAYELLSGQVPFHAEEPAVAVLLRHMNEPIPPLQEVAPEVGEELSCWVERLLEKEPSRRPARAAEAWEELEEIVIGLLGPRWRRDARLADETTDGAAVPTVRVAGRTPELPARTRPRRRWLLVAGGVPAIAAAGAIAAIALTGGSGKDAAQPQAGKSAVPLARVSLAAAGNALFVADRSGRLLELSPSSLDTRAVAADPAGPRSVAAPTDRVVLADRDGITVLSSPDHRPLGAARLPGAAAVAGGAGAPLTAISSRGRLCLIQASTRLQPCVRLGFEPSGLGSAPSGVIAVADGKGGSIVLYRKVGKRLAPLGSPVAVGSRPHGSLVFHRGRLYSPVAGGIAVVDPLGRRRVRLIGLASTPAAVWIVPFSGRLFATLPSSDSVAVLDTAFPSTPATIVHVGKRPTAVAGGLDPEGAGEAVYVVGEGDSTVTRLDPITGTRLSSARVTALARSTERLVLRRARVNQLGRSSLVTLSLDGGGLDPAGLVVRDARIADGHAVVELWQGGITSLTKGGHHGGLALKVGKAPGRLEVVLTADRGAFDRLQAKRAGGRQVLIVLTRPALPQPPPIRPTVPDTVPQQPTTSSTSTIPTTTNKPKPPPKHPSTSTVPTIPTG